jgi:poly(3-hydroxybutyrate) depolymerase
MRNARSLAVLAVLVAAAASPAPAQDDDGTIRPSRWLVIEPVDVSGRRPLGPDAVFLEHLLDPSSPPPVEGGKLTGEREVERTWVAVAPDEKGRVALVVDDDRKSISYAYTSVEVPDARVMRARLPGGATLYVNGTGYVGDVYAYGFGGVPVAVRAGTNHLFVRGIRGSFELTLHRLPDSLVAADWDFTQADVVVGEPRGLDTSALVLNGMQAEIAGDALPFAVSGGDGFEPTAERAADPIGPLCVARLALPVQPREGHTFEAGTDVALSFRLEHGPADGTQVLDETTLKLKVRSPDQPNLVTFRARMDGTVQHYAVRRPQGESDRPMGLVLSVHGAGVRCRNQARSYAAKPDFWIVAPTNRRPFGFDWQDWGRTDAYEVLADALAESGVERSRVHVTGHSMGGHGAWHLAANDPDGFAAVAPSAGWISFDTYGRGRGRPAGALRGLWHRADGTSRTMDLLGNLAQLPTFILHGTADDNVPVKQAEAMERALLAAGAFPQAHYQADAGHWWNLKDTPGADCLDWPGIFALFREHRIPEHPGEIEFTSVAPAVDADHHWLHVHQPLEYGRSVHLRARVEAERSEIVVQTSNVRAFRLDVPVWADVDLYHVDGVAFDAMLHPGGAWFVRENGLWRLAAHGPGREEKGPHRSGPFKRAFDNRFVLVYGTQGSERETAELLARARFDSGQWWYRGNGNAPVVSDGTFVEGADGLFGGRNVIVYGNSDTNAAWDVVFREDCPVSARRGEIRLGDHLFEGHDLAAVFLHPRAGDGGALAAAFADTGPAGSRLAYKLATFGSGVGIPDYVVFGPGVLTEGDGGVLAAGWFDRRWRHRGGYLRTR